MQPSSPTESRPGGSGARADAGLTTVFAGERATRRRLRKAKVVVAAGPDAGREVELDKARFTGGRSIINDLVLTDKAVSGTHFEIVADDAGYRLRDLDSSNGIFVGELRIREVYLQPGTVFRLGHTHLLFQPLQDVVEIDLSEQDRFDRVIGASPIMREIFARLEKVAQSELTCLITGETGTGKELVARGIHAASPRRDKPFVVLDCGSIPRELIESTLFGHEKGSFTGAVGQHQGCFEQADGGTIFLDEIGELDVTLQPRLLRVLEQREITRVGGSRPIKVDVRVLAATNRDLRAGVNTGSFREDLFFRLSVVHVELPPLRVRHEDIPLIAQHVLREVSSRRGISLAFGQDAMNALQVHSWPGNVRELRNVVERAAALGDGPVLSRADLVFGRDPGPSAMVAHDLAQAGTRAAQGAMARMAGREHEHEQGDGPARFDPALFVAGYGFKDAKQAVVDAFESAYLEALLTRNEGNISRSAQEAGLTRYHLRELLKRHNLSPR
ncbi:sigma 54-interacting transcriptional regulator [Haliangium ochraceum]|uniref:Sigma54 specific transcriptional regulator, Fis family n=1 Tax=Haliangium ochraceum (strain DSM 14365 / JCM 11303 / SMP-2) TaxID=502025 RepID=D0LGN5_HALO1|nr:sigma 54-interacting transcriptional regulator [Haliangium ochraceum]ACY12781.1 sigma54 specific transcriptional regulator, Fis family [Haliangium ochraceum DSM 14365]